MVWTETLQRNGPIQMEHFRDADSLRWLVKALQENQHVRRIYFEFGSIFSKTGQELLPEGHWDPLLREIETLPNLNEVTIECNPFHESAEIPLYRDYLFQTLQRNATQRLTLILKRVNFCDDDVDGLVAFLEGAPNLRELTLQDCYGVADIGALQRNSHLQHLVSGV